MCGALVGTLSNKKEFPTTTSSSEVADHREVNAGALSTSAHVSSLVQGALSQQMIGAGVGGLSERSVHLALSSGTSILRSRQPRCTAWTIAMHLQVVGCPGGPGFDA